MPLHYRVVNEDNEVEAAGLSLPDAADYILTFRGRDYALRQDSADGPWRLHVGRVSRYARGYEGLRPTPLTSCAPDAHSAWLLMAEAAATLDLGHGLVVEPCCHDDVSDDVAD